MENLDKLWILSAELEGLLLLMRSKQGSDLSHYEKLAVEKFRQMENLMFPQLPVEQDAPADDAEVADNALFEESEDADEPVAEQEQILSPTSESDPEDEAPSPTTPEPEQEQNLSPTSESDPEPEQPEAENVIRVEDKLARHSTRDINKAFSINDKFLFRRTLFGNNTAQYNEALELISQMDSYAETADYFFSQYGWNPEDENVKAFMAVVKHHFDA